MLWPAGVRQLGQDQRPRLRHESSALVLVPSSCPLRIHMDLE